MQNPLMPKPQPVIPVERVASRIYLIRGEKVMLDFDLAELYGVPTKVLNQAVRRNKDRFPEDFMFQLKDQEFANLRSQIVTSSWGGRRRPPYVFTEQGVAMLATVLRSEKAIQINIAIIRTFVKIRQILASNRDLARKVQEHDRQIAMLFDTVEKLLAPPAPPKKNPIGYIKTRND
jgi:phage regulator Rha-like protein